MRGRADAAGLAVALAAAALPAALVLILAPGARAMPLHPAVRDALQREGKLDAFAAEEAALRRRGYDRPAARPPRRAAARGGAGMHVPVLLVDFPDNPWPSTGDEFTPAHFDSLLFSRAVYPTGSMRDY